MPDLNQEIFPGQGSLNWDDDRRAMPKNDAEYRLNVIPNAHGNNYVLTNLKGNTQYEHTFDHADAYAAATYTPIGDVYDDNRDAIYFFIYSDQGNDSILRFNFSDKSFDKIAFDHTGLGLDPDYPITDAYMIGDWLHFNPRTSSPRAIQVQWAYYDFIAYEHEIGVVDGTEWSVGDYVKSNNKVYLINATGVDRDDGLLWDHPEKITFVEWTYQDVDTYPPSTDYGTYKRYRDFYNIPMRPNTARPYAALGDDTDVETNFIRGNIFQFTYRYYVPGQGYTIAAPFSEMIVNDSDESLNGERLGEVTANNYIEVGVQVPTVYNNSGIWLFEFMEILFRQNDETDWRIADKIYHDDACTYATRLTGIGAGTFPYACSTYFYNNRAYAAVDTLSIEKPYNPLPVLARAQWSLDGERTAYGGVTEGRDGVNGPLSVKLTNGNRPIQLKVDVDTASTTTTHTFTVTEDPVLDKFIIYDYTTTVAAVPSGSTPWYIEVALDGEMYYGTYDGASAADYRTKLVSLINQGSVTAFVNGNNIEFGSKTPHAIQIKAYADSLSTTAVTKVKSLKTNAEHPYCIYYHDDAGRRSDPQTQVRETNYGTSIFIPALPDEGTLTKGLNHQQYVQWAIAHDAPSWAVSWRWGYAGNRSISDFWQYNIESIEVPTTGDFTDFIEIDISGLQTLASKGSGNDNYFPDTNIPAYRFVPGDRIKFLSSPINVYGDTTTTTTTFEAVTDAEDVYLADTGHDFEIKFFDDIDNTIYIDGDALDANELLGYGSAPNQVVVEIYRRLKAPENTVYHEVGDIFQVYLDSGTGRYFHRGETQDQTASVPATGEFTTGDVYLITRALANAPFTDSSLPVFVESYHWSDFYDSNQWGRGKAGFVSGIGQKYLNNIRYSNRYSPNTLTSGLSTFDFLDYKEMSTDHGNITAMRQAGNTLKVYFERNSAAVLVNKQQLYNADGTSSVISSDNVLGDAVYSNYHYGTIFPESVKLKDRTVFFYDIYRNAYIKDSSNGLGAISDNKMKRYFNEKSAALLSSGVSNVQVWSSYDYEHDILLVHFIDAYDSTNDEVIMYHEPQDKWVAFHQISDEIKSVPTTTTTTSSTSTSTTSTTSTHSYDTGLVFGRGSMKLVSYVGDAIYIHNSNAVRNNFWGVQRDSIVEVVANEAPTIKKTFEAIALHTNKPWNINYVGLSTDSTYTSGMQSKIPEARFRLIEGIFHAPYLRNMKTYTSSASNLDLIRGETLRGYYAEHRLVNDDTTEVTLFKVDVMGNVSMI